MSQSRMLFSTLLLIAVARSVLSYRFGGGLYNGPTKLKRMDAQFWIDTLDLIGNIEGGYFTEVYRSDDVIGNLPERYEGANRTLETAIYYLLEGNEFSVFHVLKSDELWHFYYGKPLSIFLIDPETGELEVANLGPNEDEHFMYLVPRGKIFGARLKNPRKGDYSLVGTTVAPGFEFEDFALPSREDLIESFPQHEDLIIELTRI